MDKNYFLKRNFIKLQTTEDIKIKIPNETIIGYDILPVHFISSPFLIYTEKATYAFIVNNGINLSTGKQISGNNTLYKLFDFSSNHPIYKNSYAIIKDNSVSTFSQKINTEIALSIGFRILSDLASIYKIYNYLSAEFNTLKNKIGQKIQKYTTTPTTVLPQIPLLKENIDAFFNCATNIISHYLTFFDIKYENGTIENRNPSLDKCIKILNKSNIKDKNELLMIFNSIKDTEKLLRDIRNYLYHPENHLFNVFLYNIYFNTDNLLTPPTLEFINDETSQNINIIEYINNFLEKILTFSKNYLLFMSCH